MIDWTKLPDLVAVGLLAWAFASVARRSPTKVSEDWLTGWLFIVAHFIVSMFVQNPGIWGSIALTGSIMSLIVASFLFMRATVSKLVSQRVTSGMLPGMTLVFGLVVCSLIFSAPRWLLNASEALLGFTPLVMTLIAPRWSAPLLRWTMSALHCALWLVLWKVQSNPNGVEFALDAILFTVYFGCAVHFWHHHRTTTTGARIGFVGFILWASVFVLAPLLGALVPGVRFESEIWNLPKYVVAIGMILLVLEDQIAHNKHLALHDELTGLPNRRLFHDRLSGALSRARRAGSCTALLMVDLDDFKLVNDTYGHHVGDLLLQHVAGLFSTRIRHSDTVARTGGDEFAVILETPTTRNDAIFVSRALLDLLEQPMQLNDQLVQVHASVGIAIFPEDAHDIKSLCIHADMRMYEGKRLNDTRYPPAKSRPPQLKRTASAPIVAG